MNRLLWIMELNGKEKKNELSRTTLNGITEEEYKEFERQLNPEIISRVLKAQHLGFEPMIPMIRLRPLISPSSR